MKKRKLLSSIAFVLSVVMLAVSGAIFVHSATQQSASTSLTVNFNGQNVNYEVQGWYHVSGGNRRELVDNDQDNDNIVTFSANEAPTEKTLKVSNTEANNKVTLTANNTYVLFTYKFVNTASSGAFGMEVSLSLTNVSGSNLKAVKYGTSTTLYTENQLSTFISSNVTSTTSFDDDFIIAGGTTLASSGTGVKYYYVLLEIDDVTLPVNFTPTFNWTVTCSEDVTEPLPPAPSSYTVTFSQTSGSNSTPTKSIFNTRDYYSDYLVTYYGSDIFGPTAVDTCVAPDGGVSGKPAGGTIVVYLYYQFGDGDTPLGIPDTSDSTLSNTWTQATSSIEVPANKTLFISFAWVVDSGYYMGGTTITITGLGSMGGGEGDRLGSRYLSTVVNSNIDFTVSISTSVYIPPWQQ